MHLIMVTLPYACYGLDVSPTTHCVVAAPPIARWMIGRSYREVWAWVQGKGGSCEWVR